MSQPRTWSVAMSTEIETNSNENPEPVSRSNDIDRERDTRMVEYQTNRLQELIAELYGCCRDRLFYEANKFNLSQAEVRCLRLFEGHKYLLAMEIADKLEVAKSRVTVLLDSLGKKGLIQRIPAPGDARVKLVNLTPAGQYTGMKVEGYVFHLHRQLLEGIPAAQRTTVIAALETLHASMQAMKASMP